MQTEKNKTLLILGPAMLLLGLAALYVFGYEPWRDALNHEPKVALSFKMLFFAPVFLLLGVGAVLPLKPLPDSETPAGDKAPVSLRGKIFIGIWLAAEVTATAYYFWLRSFLQSQGYDV